MAFLALMVQSSMPVSMSAASHRCWRWPPPPLQAGLPAAWSWALLKANAESLQTASPSMRAADGNMGGKVGRGAACMRAACKAGSLGAHTH